MKACDSLDDKIPCQARTPPPITRPTLPNSSSTVNVPSNEGPRDRDRPRQEREQARESVRLRDDGGERGDRGIAFDSDARALSNRRMDDEQDRAGRRRQNDSGHSFRDGSMRNEAQPTTPVISTNDLAPDPPRGPRASRQPSYHEESTNSSSQPLSVKTGVSSWPSRVSPADRRTVSSTLNHREVEPQSPSPEISNAPFAHPTRRGPLGGSTSPVMGRGFEERGNGCVGSLVGSQLCPV